MAELSLRIEGEPKRIASHWVCAPSHPDLRWPFSQSTVSSVTLRRPVMLKNRVRCIAWPGTSECPSLSRASAGEWRRSESQSKHLSLPGKERHSFVCLPAAVFGRRIGVDDWVLESLSPGTRRVAGSDRRGAAGTRAAREGAGCRDAGVVPPLFRGREVKQGKESVPGAARRVRKICCADSACAGCGSRDQ